MISALIGSVIMSAVTLAMLLAIDITDKALNKVKGQIHRLLRRR